MICYKCRFSDIICNIIDFQDSKDVLMEIQSVAIIFLEGKWLSADGEYFFNLEKQSEDYVYYSYSIPFFEMDNSHIGIKDGHLFLYSQDIRNNKPFDAPMIEAVANHLPAHFAIKTFGIGAVLGFCRASMKGVVFSKANTKIYEQYLMRNKKKIRESADQYEIAINYMQKNNLLAR